ncbi:hypothetical protein ACFYWS_38130 [Streptomyces sp. NPDC002795]|uniref:hypothetical protein n=1 Tax=Streptomyces sp. NPDC002795 TaxID=3364665 RepID=UPI00367B9689
MWRAARSTNPPYCEAEGSGDTYQIDPDPLNSSGAKGTAMLMVDGTRLTVKIDASGLVPGQPHAQYVHGSTDGHDFHCPDASADKNKDGIVTTAEGLPAYGDINISLTTKGDTSKKSGLAVDRMPVADKNGRLAYERTITVSPKVAEHIKDLHVVQHGIDPNANGKHDFGKGKSPPRPGLLNPCLLTAPRGADRSGGAGCPTRARGPRLSVHDPYSSVVMCFEREGPRSEPRSHGKQEHRHRGGARSRLSGREPS